jgi:2-dehydropantoate 2-reductase
MDKGKIEAVYIVGLGAMGGLYASKLQAANAAKIKIIADKSRVEMFKKDGVLINNKPYYFDFILPESEAPTADLIIVSVKSPQLEQAIQAIKKFVGNNTIVISLLNGISSEEIIGNEIGHEHLLYAYGVGMDAVRANNQIIYSTPGKIVFGEKHNATLTDRVVAVQYLFEKAAIPHQTPADMERALWSKFMINTSINPASAILKAPYAMFQQNKEAQQLMLLAATEVMTLANCCGIQLSRADFNDFITILNTLDPAGKTSMLQDVEAGRKTEIDLFSETVIELGKKYAVATPVNEVLFKMVKLMETD